MPFLEPAEHARVGCLCERRPPLPAWLPTPALSAGKGGCRSTAHRRLRPSQAGYLYRQVSTGLGGHKWRRDFAYLNCSTLFLSDEAMELPFSQIAELREPQSLPIGASDVELVSVVEERFRLRVGKQQAVEWHRCIAEALQRHGILKHGFVDKAGSTFSTRFSRRALQVRRLSADGRM